MRKVISFILLAFILIWSYNLFINNFIDLEKLEEEAYKGVIKIMDIPIGGSHSYSNHSWLKDKISSFERKNPGIYVELISGQKGSKIHGDMEDMPDIVSVDVNFSDFNILESLDDYFEKEELEEFKHQVLKSLTYNKELKAIPTAMTTYVIYLNLEKFNKKGVSPPLNGNWSYEEFVDALKKLTYESEEDEIFEYGFVAPVGLEYYNIWGIILSDGAEIINPRRLKYNFYGEKAIKGLEKVIDLKDKYKVVPEAFGIAGEDITWDMFHKDQNVAVYITGSWASKALDKLHKDGDGFSFDIANYPVGDKGLPTILNNGIVSYGVIKKNNPKKTKACVKLLKHLTNNVNQKDLEDIGLFTVKRHIDDMYKDDLRMKKIEESLSYTEYIPFVDNWTDIETIINKEIKKAIAKEKISYEAIEDAKIKIDEMNEN